MATEEESVLVLVHCSGKIQKSKRYGVKFTDREPVSVFISSSSTLSDLKNSILQKLGISGSKWVKKLFYKIPITVVSTRVQYDTFVLAADEDIRVLFHCVRSFPEVRIHELFTKLDVGVDSSGASAPFHNSTGVGGSSCLMPVIAPSVPLVTYPSFAADLDRTEAVGSAPLQNPGVCGLAYEVGTGGGLIPDVQGFREPDRVENAMYDDESDQEPVDIIGDSYPPHFSTLNLEALGDKAEGGPTVGGSSSSSVCPTTETSIQPGQCCRTPAISPQLVQRCQIRQPAKVDPVRVLVREQLRGQHHQNISTRVYTHGLFTSICWENPEPLMEPCVAHCHLLYLILRR
ncbi:hypothetical protein Ahy_A07g036577 [Arachis hypogaea]|uniref:Uncharacterized protein n=1 Tax=Arachis hypogaea TaxID=3818 RepID=A0A445CGI4_ARAHY|nr:hypothetical protein Ahy_A07g036577 [Arachis hypogaea]